MRRTTHDRTAKTVLVLWVLLNLLAMPLAFAGGGQAAVEQATADSDLTAADGFASVTPVRGSISVGLGHPGHSLSDAAPFDSILIYIALLGALLIVATRLGHSYYPLGIGITLIAVVGLFALSAADIHALPNIRCFENETDCFNECNPSVHPIYYCFDDESDPEGYCPDSDNQPDDMVCRPREYVPYCAQTACGRGTEYGSRCVCIEPLLFGYVGCDPQFRYDYQCESCGAQTGGYCDTQTHHYFCTNADPIGNYLDWDSSLWTGPEYNLLDPDESSAACTCDDNSNIWTDASYNVGGVTAPNISVNGHYCCGDDSGEAFSNGECTDTTSGTPCTTGDDCGSAMMCMATSTLATSAKCRLITNNTWYVGYLCSTDGTPFNTTAIDDRKSTLRYDQSMGSRDDRCVPLIGDSDTNPLGPLVPSAPRDSYCDGARNCYATNAGCIAAGDKGNALSWGDFWINGACVPGAGTVDDACGTMCTLGWRVLNPLTPTQSLDCVSCPNMPHANATTAACVSGDRRCNFIDNDQFCDPGWADKNTKGYDGCEATAIGAPVTFEHTQCDTNGFEKGSPNLVNNPSFEVILGLGVISHW
ncbi:hypothetical protein JXB02_04330 [Candidatus Woesearchaeota archaeon]|nr:hypothetical protein [Candidatus Woesearchaeota archaeon]